MSRALHLTRRNLLALGGAFALARPWTSVLAQTPASDIELLPDLTIDMPGDPDSIDPAIAYSARDWSIVHAIYDGLVGIGEDGTIQPLAAGRFETVDDVTFEAALRPGLTFHDGSPVTSDAAIRGVEHLQGGDSLVVDLFSVIDRVERVDDLTLRIVCSEPAAWLPAQMAVWHMLLPENADADSLANDPVGNGPYRFVSWEKGSQVRLERFADYQPTALKGAPIAGKVTYRAVPEASTRVADLISGATQIATFIPVDQMDAAMSGGADVVLSPIVGSGWIRIATDTPPFDDVRVRQALNYGLDVDAIAKVFISAEAHRLASLHPDARSMGFDPDLAPYAYDPDKARQLLADAGVGDGLDVVLEMTTSVPQALAEAIVAQWAEVGIEAEIRASEYAEFNANWADSSAPPLKQATWSPLYDPHTLLDLVFSGNGYLSRYDNPEVTDLIEAAAIEPDQETRAAIYRKLAGIMHEDAPAVFLWNLVDSYGVQPEASAWQPRGDEYVLPLT